MKASEASLWVRNVQLAVFGIPQAALPSPSAERALRDREPPRRHRRTL